MIVQFLNGSQLVLADQITLSDALSAIFSRVDEFELEGVFLASQIKLLQSESEPALWYAINRSMTDVTFDEMSKDVKSIVCKEERYQTIDAYIQAMADAREFKFSATRGRYYEIYDKEYAKCLSGYYSDRNDWEFAHPESYALLRVSEEEGKLVYNHWVSVNGERFALSTIVHEEDLD